MRAIVFCGLIGLLAFSCAFAYTPGSGSVYSDDFEELDAGWTQGNGYNGPSPWIVIDDGADRSFQADGRGPFVGSPTRHWAQRDLTPTRADAFAVALEFRADQGAGYVFHLDLIQRAELARIVRLEVDGSGTLFVQKNAGSGWETLGSAAGLFPAGQKRWLRLALDRESGGELGVRVRVWDGGAAAEPSSWNLELVDPALTLERVHRLELEADGPKGVETFIDELDVFGDTARGIDSSIETIYIAELSHLDIGFTKPPDDIETFGKTHLDQVLGNLAADPDYRWMIESGWWLEKWWARSNEAERQELVDRLREGRLVLSSSYANMHTTRQSAESLRRTVYWSRAFGREHGVPTRLFFTDDVPGSTFALPGILADAGIDYYIGGMNCSFGGQLTTPDHGDRPFWWVGPDGERVLSWITFESYAEAFQWGFSFFDGMAELHQKLGKKLPEQEEAGYPYPEIMILRGFDNHYQGFKARNLADQWNAQYETPRFELLNADEFLDHMRATYGDESFPSFSGDFGAAWSASQAKAPHTRERSRQANRDAGVAESLLALAQTIDGGSGRLAERRALYGKILESDEHTGAGGWPGYFTPEEMERNNTLHLAYATDARDQGAALAGEGATRLAAAIPSKGDRLAVLNPLGFTRDAWADVALPPELFEPPRRLIDRVSGSELPYQRDETAQSIRFRAAGLPPFGYRVYELVPGTPSAEPSGELTVTANSLQNGTLRIEVDAASGAVTSFVDRARGVELVDVGASYGFNTLAKSLHQEMTHGVDPSAVATGSASLDVRSGGPLCAALVVTRTGTPHVETEYRLCRGDGPLEIVNVLDRAAMPWVPQAQHSHAYTVALPFAIADFSLRTETATRFLDPLADSFARSSVFDWHNVENVLAFWDESAGVRVSSDSVIGFHFERLHNLGSAGFSHAQGLLFPRLYDKADEYEFEGGSIGPYVTEPGTPSRSATSLFIAPAAPGFEATATRRYGKEALIPPRTALLGPGAGNLPSDQAALIEIAPSTLSALTLKPAELGTGVVLRVGEMNGVATEAEVFSDLFTIVNAERLEADEEGGEPLALVGGRAQLSLAPYETVTLRLVLAPSWSPISLSAAKGAGAVTLSWSGGIAPYTLERSTSPRFDDTVQLVEEEDTATHDDPVLTDGQVYFYRVR